MWAGLTAWTAVRNRIGVSSRKQYAVINMVGPDDIFIMSDSTGTYDFTKKVLSDYIELKKNVTWKRLQSRYTHT